MYDMVYRQYKTRTNANMWNPHVYKIKTIAYKHTHTVVDKFHISYKPNGNYNWRESVYHPGMFHHRKYLYACNINIFKI